MGKVAILFKVYPKEGEFDKAMSAIKEEMHPASMQAEDIAFGIKVIKVLFTFEDKERASSDLEERLKKIDGVSEVEVGEESLL